MRVIANVCKEEAKQGGLSSAPHLDLVCLQVRVDEGEGNGLPPGCQREVGVRQQMHRPLPARVRQNLGHLFGQDAKGVESLDAVQHECVDVFPRKVKP